MPRVMCLGVARLLVLGIGSFWHIPHCGSITAHLEMIPHALVRLLDAAQAKLVVRRGWAPIGISCLTLLEDLPSRHVRYIVPGINTPKACTSQVSTVAEQI
eukprot:TRINITY_DN65857_c0_g1_i1.p2 TRINITY_DN65857_c0_g1~~TRINITY_DN65857_c0_g1_i1.p2  ORF type:complete len:101 (+),score=13.62 TRINITY_DN65857_c0_g1_i1:257-559(+)